MTNRRMTNRRLHLAPIRTFITARSTTPSANEVGPRLLLDASPDMASDPPER
jgi:hypothetical protein